MRVLVIGASGRTGKLVVSGLQERGMLQNTPMIQNDNSY